LSTVASKGSVVPVRRVLMQPFSRDGRSVVDCRRELPLSLDSVLLDDGGERQVPK
jgi:hypothetical protein